MKKENIAYKWKKIFAAINNVKGQIILSPEDAQELIDNIEEKDYLDIEIKYIKALIIEQEDYIRELIDEDSIYTLEEYLDVTKSDKMEAYVSNAEVYNFELGKYIAYNDILEKINKE